MIELELLPSYPRVESRESRLQGCGVFSVSLMVMMTMLDKKMPLSMLVDEMKMYPQCLKNVRVKSKPDAQNDPDVQAAVRAAADALGESGRILVRESGTEPKIRVMVEAESDEICEKYVDSVIDVIQVKGHIAD